MAMIMATSFSLITWMIWFLMDGFILLCLRFKCITNVHIKKIFFIFLFSYICTNKLIMEEKQRAKPGRKELPKELKRKIVTAYLTDAEKQFIIENYGSLTKFVKSKLN